MQTRMLETPTPRSSAPFPLRNPGLVSIPLAFAVAIVVAVLFPEPEAEARFAEVEQRVHVGIDHPSSVHCGGYGGTAAPGLGPTTPRRRG